MSSEDRNKAGTLMNAKLQVLDGSIDELLLDEALREKLQKIELLEQRLNKLTEQLGDIENTDFLAAYNKAKS